MELEILFQDEHLVAINKPHGLLVHRSLIAKDATEYALQTVRNQLNKHVYPCHRLDRKTSGVLLFALNDMLHKQVTEIFRERQINKKYLAIVRGFTNDKGTIDYALKSEKGNLQEAITHYVTKDRYEIPLASGKHNSSRYSLLDVTLDTGRMHQIRRHLAHIFHPIIGDRPHGCNKQNKLWKEHFGMTTMMLHAESLSFVHPVTTKPLIISAKTSDQFNLTLSLLGAPI